MPQRSEAGLSLVRYVTWLHVSPSWRTRWIVGPHGCPRTRCLRNLRHAAAHRARASAASVLPCSLSSLASLASLTARMSCGRSCGGTGILSSLLSASGSSTCSSRCCSDRTSCASSPIPVAYRSSGTPWSLQTIGSRQSTGAHAALWAALWPVRSRTVAHDRVSFLPRHRYCTRSDLHRPLRSHFCSITRRVVLNMDHFCPWVVNTVGFYNRKFFVLFLFYTMLSCCWVLLTALPVLLELRRPGALRALERQIGPTKCARRAPAPAHITRLRASAAPAICWRLLQSWCARWA